jgi:hypothetical protein
MENRIVKKTVLAVVAATALVSASVHALSEQDLARRAQDSREAIGALQGALVKELQAAMQSGGPTNAIAVCNTRAPLISAEVSKGKGMTIGRTSLKLRNPGNAPDAWEKKVLESFEARKAKGEDPAKLEHYEVAKVDGKDTFRYMKAIAIPQDAPCLKCHGSNLDPAVAARLKELYPKDQATGFSTGDLRGAFTVKQPL